MILLTLDFLFPLVALSAPEYSDGSKDWRCPTWPWSLPGRPWLWRRPAGKAATAGRQSL